MKYFYWNKVPLLRLLLPFAVGIVSAVFIGIFPIAITLIAFLAIASICILHYSGFIANNYSKRWLFGIFVNLLFLCTGHLLTALHIEINDDKHFSKHIENEELFVGYITEPLTEKDKSYKTVIEINSLINNEKAIPVKGKILTYISKDSLSAKLNYGDKIVFKAMPVVLSEPQNPYEFNYKRFLSFNKIYHQGYVKSENVKLTGLIQEINLFHLLYNRRKNCYGYLEKIILQVMNMRYYLHSCSVTKTSLTVK